MPYMEERKTMYVLAQDIAATKELPFMTVYKRLQRSDSQEMAARPLGMKKIQADRDAAIELTYDAVVEHMRLYDNQSPTLQWVANETGLKKSTVRVSLAKLADQGRLKRIENLGRYVVVQNCR